MGDAFSNTANIYFDYNFPILTNVATTTIQTLANPDFEFGQYFSIAPNPTAEILHIKTQNGIVISAVSIYNVLGQLTLTITNPQSGIDVSGLDKGSYFIKVNSDKGSSSAKFIKE